jgi:hypothetical protein
MNPTFRLTNENYAVVVKAILAMVLKALRGGSVIVTLGRETRTNDQNRKMWATLADISNQVPWHGLKLMPEEYKDLLTAGLKKSKVVPNLDSTGFVILGYRTSKMNKREFSELIEFIYAFGAERGVVWSDDSLSCFDEMIDKGSVKV